ncbi:MAG: ATP-binding protein [Planctomycetota bacterium]
MSAPANDLPAFFQHLRLNNPFDDNRITRTDAVPDSVESIHSEAWQELILQTQRASTGSIARSVLITGPPGIGKSHLLARFREWAVSERHPFVYLLNLQSGPRDLLRSIVRGTLQALSRDLSRTPLQCRLFKLVQNAVRAAGQRYAPGEELSLPRAERLYLRLVDEYGLPSGTARVLWAFFEDLYRLHFRQPPGHIHQLALQWLSGDAIDPEPARDLQLFTATADEGVAASNEELREILQVLCRFAAFRSRCLILAFDQIDTLSEDQVRAWTAAAHGLLDLCPGLMLVCSGVDSTLYQWTQKSWVSRASWDDRLRQFSIGLSGIHENEARQMIRRRLHRSLAAFTSNPEIAAAISRDPDFPLGQSWLQQQLREADGTPRTDLRPRDVMNLAARRWERCFRDAEAAGLEQWLRQTAATDTAVTTAPAPANMTLPSTVATDPTIDHQAVEIPVAPSVTAAVAPAAFAASAEATAHPDATTVDNFLAERLEHQQQRRGNSEESLPVDPGNLLGMIHRLLLLCQHSAEPWRSRHYSTLQDCRDAPRPGAGPATFHLILEHFERSTGRRKKLGLAVLENASGQATAALLKRLLRQLNQESRVDHAVLLTDARRPLNPGSQGQTYLADLKAEPGRFTLHELSFTDYAALDAITQLVRSAAAGELYAALHSEAGRTLNESEVVDWLHRTERLITIPILLLLTRYTPDF